MAPSERVSARKGDDLVVVEAHAVEDLANVVCALVAVWQAAVRGAVLDVAVRDR